MKISLRRQWTWVFPIVSFAMACGCAGALQKIPVPPESIVNVSFDGPYDADIPPAFVKRIKAASFLADSALPDLWVGVGLYFELRGDELRSLHFYDRAIDKFQKREDRTGEATAVTRKIVLLCRFGRFPEALSEVENVRLNLSSESLRAFASYQEATYHLLRGEPHKASGLFRQSLKSLEGASVNDHLLMLKRDALLALGISLLAQEHFASLMKNVQVENLQETQTDRTFAASSRDCFQQAVALNALIRKSNLGHCLPEEAFDVIDVQAGNHLALCDALEGKYVDAAAGFDAALRTAKDRLLTAGEIETLFLSTVAHLPVKDKEAGIQAARRLIDLADQYHLQAYRIWGRFLLSRYELSRGDLKAAVGLLGFAIHLLESHAAGETIEAWRKISYIDSRVLYDDLIVLHARQGNAGEALQTAERAKARTLIDLIGDADIGKTPEESIWIRNVYEASAKTTAGYTKASVIALDKGALSESLKEIRSAQDSYSEILDSMKTHNEELYALFRAESPDLQEIHHLLDPNTTLFCYYVANRSFYIWVINRNHFRMMRVDKNREEVAALVLALRKAIRQRDKKQTELLSEKAYTWFLKPFIGLVSGDRIGLVLHDALHYLPFAAMSNKREFLIEGFSVFDLPQAGALKYALKKQPSQGIRILVWADTKANLAFVQDEIQAVRRSFPRTDILPAGDAAKGIINQSAGDYDFIHFAARAMIRQDEPMMSGFSGSPAGANPAFLNLEDVFGWQLSGHGVVVSASQSEAGVVSNGSEIALFNRAFLYAGSPGLIKSLWRVESRARVIFMELLYKNLDKDLSMADALRQAQAEMNQIGFAPFDWAGYTLTGPF
jgi:CHAT domain-containing protein